LFLVGGEAAPDGLMVSQKFMRREKD
jgi:hypothetical protein